MVRAMLIDMSRHCPAKRTLIARRAIKATEKPREHMPLWLRSVQNDADRFVFRYLATRRHESMFWPGRF